VPSVSIDGIATRYEVAGSGPPLLMFSPGGFNAAVENWVSFGIYARLNLLEPATPGPHLHGRADARPWRANP